jgi:filamentous hemagglutinin family protein
MSTGKLYLLFSLVPLTLSALPQGAEVKSGKVSFQEAEKGKLLVKASNRAILHYESFNIAEGESVEFIQPKKSSTVLNRVTTDNPSALMGQLSGNGRVFLVNQHGVFIGPNAIVETGSFIASTMEILNQDFLNDRFHFFIKPGSENAHIVNEGTIITDPEGLLALLSPNITNKGTLLAEQGKALLFAGDTLMGFILDRGELINADAISVATTLVEENGVVRLIGSLQADTICVQAEKVFVEGELIAQKQLYLEGRQEIEVLTDLFSGGDLTFVSSNPISADGYFLANGNLSFLTPEGNPGGFTSVYDPIVTSTGSVTFGTYNGPSLKVSAMGNIICTGDITITGPDVMACPAGFCMMDPDCMTLTTTAALLLYAGQMPVSSPGCNPVPVFFGMPPTLFSNPGGAGSTINLGGNLSGFEVAVFSGDVVLTAATIITSTGTQTITFDGNIDGSFGLTLDGYDITVNGAIGSATPLSSLGVHADSLFTANGSVTAGTIASDATTVSLDFSDSITTTTSGGIQLIGNGAITLNAMSATNGGGISVALNTAGPSNLIDLSGTSVADADISITSITNIAFSGATSVTSNMGNLFFQAEGIDSAQNVTLSAPLGDITVLTTMTSGIGALTPLKSFTIPSAITANLPSITTGNNGAISITAGALTQNGSIASTNGAITINAPMTLTTSIAVSSGNAPISFSNVDGGFNLITGSGTKALTFAGSIGSVTPLTILQGTGGEIFLGADLTTTSTIALTGPITLTGNSTLTLDGTLMIAGTINGNRNLTIIMDDQNASIAGNIGAVTPLKNFSIRNYHTFTAQNIQAGTISIDYLGSSLGSTTIDDLTSSLYGGIFLKAGGFVTLNNATAGGSGALRIILNTSGVGNQISLNGMNYEAGGLLLIDGDNGLSPIAFSEAATLTSHTSSVTLRGSAITAQGISLNAQGPISVSPASITLTSDSLNATTTAAATFPAISTQSGGVIITASQLTLNGDIVVNNGPITLNAPLTFTATRTLNAGSGTVTLNDAATSTTSGAGFTVQGGQVNQNSSVTTNNGSVTYTTTTLNLGGGITTGSALITTTGNTFLTFPGVVTLNTLPGGGVALGGAINGTSANNNSLTIQAGTGTVSLGNLGNTLPLKDLVIDAGTINFQGVLYTAKKQTYTAANNFNFSSAGLISVETLGGDLAFYLGTVRLNAGSNFLIETNGGDLFLNALTGSGLENVDILAGNGSVEMGAMSMLDSLLIYSGDLLFDGAITVEEVNVTSNHAILNGGGPVLVTTSASASFNALNGTVGSSGSPISLAIGGFAYAGAPQKLANFIGITSDNTVHSIPFNPPCPLIFNGVTLVNCLPSGPSNLLSLPARTFYVVGIYSQYNSLASDDYFLPEVVTPHYVEPRKPLLSLRGL